MQGGREPITEEVEERKRKSRVRERERETRTSEDRVYVLYQTPEVDSEARDPNRESGRTKQRDEASGLRTRAARGERRRGNSWNLLHVAPLCHLPRLIYFTAARSRMPAHRASSSRPRAASTHTYTRRHRVRFPGVGGHVAAGLLSLAHRCYLYYHHYWECYHCYYYHNDKDKNDNGVNE